MDVRTAFLNNSINETVYMEIPLGVDCSNEFRQNNVCKLSKALYGLKISPQKWNQHFTALVKKIGLIPCEHDPCLFKLRQNETVVYLLLYVNDMLIASNETAKLTEIKNILKSEFEMTDLGEPKIFLGFELKRDRYNNILCITQHKFMLKMLNKFNMQDSKQYLTPMVTKGNKPK